MDFDWGKYGNFFVLISVKVEDLKHKYIVGDFQSTKPMKDVCFPSYICNIMFWQSMGMIVSINSPELFVMLLLQHQTWPYPFHIVAKTYCIIWYISLSFIRHHQPGNTARSNVTNIHHWRLEPHNTKRQTFWFYLLHSISLLVIFRGHRDKGLIT